MVSMQLGISLDLEEAVTENEQRGFRAVKVVIDYRRPRLVAQALLTASSDLSEGLEGVIGLLEDAKPCIILLWVRDCLGTLVEQEGAEAANVDWLLLSWTPEDAPPKDKMKYACSKKTLREKFKGMCFKELFLEDRSSLTLDAALASCKPMSEEERDAVSTREERYAKQIENVRDAQTGAGAPQIDYGLRGRRIESLPSFDEALERLCAGGDANALVARIATVEVAYGVMNGRELSGEALLGVTFGSSSSNIGDKLPTREACYVLLRLRDGRLVLLVWRPKGAASGDKYLYSASRPAVRILVEGKAENREVEVLEAADLLELNDGLKSIGAI